MQTRSRASALTASHSRRPAQVACFLTTLLWLAALLALAATAHGTDNHFLLRAPASEIDAIAATHSLTVLDNVEVSQDALGRRVYLVEAAPGIDPGQVISNVLSMEPDAAGMEKAAVASMPESFVNPNLNQGTVDLEAAMLDTTEVVFGKNPDGSDRNVWNGYVDQPAAALLNVSAAQSTYKGDATVAIIDTGIDPNHPLLADHIVPGYDFVNDVAGTASEWGDLDQSSVVILDQSSVVILDQSSVVILDQSSVVILDDAQINQLDVSSIPPAFGHGTMVAGIIHRVAPDAKLMPLKAFDGNGDGSLFDVVRAIYYAVDNGANVINMSFSVKGFSPELMRAVNHAARNGVTCAAAAGNEGEETLVYPAALGNTIGVASTSINDVLSPFSNFGSDLVTVAAPGEDVVTTYPGGGWAQATGTSFSAPWISGAVALFADKNGTEHAPGKADYYLSSDALSYDMPVHGLGAERSGYGRVDIEWALDELEPD